MNLAEPAPKVEPAVAESKAPSVEPATALMARQSEATRVTPPPPVEPAIVHSDNRMYAPNNVANPKPASPSALSVEELRGGSGAAFESYAAVLRGAPDKNFLKACLPCIYGDRDFVAYGEVQCYILVKAESVFVFTAPTDLAPLYAIPLDDVYPITEDPNHLDPKSVTISPSVHHNKSGEHYVTVLLKYKKDGGQAYQFTFDSSNDPSLAKRFADAIEQESSKVPVVGPVTVSYLKAAKVAETAKLKQPTI